MNKQIKVRLPVGLVQLIDAELVRTGQRHRASVVSAALSRYQDALAAGAEYEERIRGGVSGT